MLRRFAPAAVSASAVATTESPSSAMNSASAEPSDCATVRAAAVRSAPYRSNATTRPLRADRLLEGGLHHVAVGVVRHQRRERSLADAGRVIDDAVDVGLRQEAQQIDAAAGDAGIGRERDHRNAARARQLRGRRHRRREQRTENDLGALVERLLRRLAARPAALPPSSLIRSWMLGFWNSASAISAAFFIDCAATPALPEADSGRIRPTLTCPVPTASGCCCGPGGPGRPGTSRTGWRCRRRRRAAARRGRAAAGRRASAKCAPPGRCLAPADPTGPGLRLNGPTISSLLLTDRRRPGLRLLARLERSEPPLKPMPDSAYCRRIVNQNKRIVVPRRRCPCRTCLPRLRMSRHTVALALRAL